ncbi:MAG TPA: SUMF1/EgtB/PvdO family nonheme iron enzyme [Planctomycetota bacterium]|nr:SUMF1/EgtB/PvdO family nonheme iron enzyme [Planctomycetota bacterium]
MKYLPRMPLATPTLVRVPDGEYRMGAKGSRLLNDQPRHDVFVRAFSIASVPVTTTEYARFLRDTGHEAPRGWDEPRFRAPSQPVVGVSWFDAIAFCEWLSARTGRAHRLPTEAEREWAARGGADVEYPWGDAPLDREGPLSRPDPVASGAPNALGLHDMGTGVHEWCSDWYDARYYAVSPVVDPRGPETGVRRVARGGSWRHLLPFSRSTARSALDPAKRFTDFGFRVASSLA